jgi:tetratricopeptide (TPR) repeat protein
MVKHLQSSPNHLVRVSLVVLLIGLGWQVLSLGMADAKSQSAPEQALQWRPQHSTALFLLAEQQVKMPAMQATQARKNALSALQAYPLEAKAYRVLGLVADSQKKPALAFEFFQKAVRYSPRDLESHVWLLNYSLRAGNADAAVYHLDRLLRMKTDAVKPLLSVIGGLAIQAQSRTALVDRMKKNPPWRSMVSTALMAQEDAVSNYDPFFNQLRNTAAGLSDSEQQDWLRALNRGRLWSLAYLNWASQLPEDKQQELGNLFNGNFEFEPLGSEFDWQFGRIPGALIDLAFREGVQDRKALRIQFNDRRVQFNHVQQTLVLPPGRYRLSGRRYAENLRSDVGLVWVISCLGTGISVATSEPLKGTSADWQPFTMDFTVPKEQCPAQWLLLKLPARIPSEFEIAGVAWFDALRIQKIQGLTEQTSN